MLNFHLSGPDNSIKISNVRKCDNRDPVPSSSQFLKQAVNRVSQRLSKRGFDLIDSLAQRRLKVLIRRKSVEVWKALREIRIACRNKTYRRRTDVVQTSCLIKIFNEQLH
jgi:hypothetical protein